MEGRYRDQIAALNTRLGELDTENRKLREVKYELDTKVRSAAALSQYGSRAAGM